MTLMRSELGTLTPGFGQWNHQLWSLQPGARKTWGPALWPSHQEIRKMKHLRVTGWLCTHPGVLTVSAEMNQGLTLGQALCSRLFVHCLIVTFQ